MRFDALYGQAMGQAFAVLGTEPVSHFRDGELLQVFQGRFFWQSATRDLEGYRSDFHDSIEHVRMPRLGVLTAGLAVDIRQDDLLELPDRAQSYEVREIENRLEQHLLLHLAVCEPL